MNRSEHGVRRVKQRDFGSRQEVVGTDPFTTTFPAVLIQTPLPSTLSIRLLLTVLSGVLKPAYPKSQSRRISD